MTLAIPGKIYLADQRDLLETNYLRRYSTFSFGEYAHPDKQAFGRLYGFNEETLAGAHTLKLAVSQASYVLLLPLTGALNASVTAGATAGPTARIEVEEVRLLALPAGAVLHLTNPYETDLVSFLHIWLLADEPVAEVIQQAFSFDLPATENQLAEIVLFGASQGKFTLSLGRLAGRHEAVYPLRKPGAQFFTFVLAGAFEVAGRLLHAHDGLALWQVAAVELEALSNDALVVLLELA